MIHNAGGVGEQEVQWTRLIDLDTKETLYSGYLGLDTCQRAGPATVTKAMPSRNWRLRAEAGYGSTATASAEFTVGLPGLPAEIPLVPMAVGAAVGGIIGYVAKPGALGTLVGAGLGTAAGYALSTLGLGQGVSLAKAPSFGGGIATERAPPPPRVSGALA
jgi:hypothetical protein